MSPPSTPSLYEGGVGGGSNYVMSVLKYNLVPLLGARYFEIRILLMSPGYNFQNLTESLVFKTTGRV